MTIQEEIGEVFEGRRLQTMTDGTTAVHPCRLMSLLECVGKVVLTSYSIASNIIANTY